MNDLVWLENTVIASVKDGWFEGDDFSTKRVTAFGQVLRGWHKIEMVTGSHPVDFSIMPRIVVLAPKLEVFGFVSRKQLPPEAVLMYLAPTLELNSQRDVTHTVAHEIAHVVLGHYNGVKHEVDIPHEKQLPEIAANELAAKWGFPARKKGRTGFVRLLTAKVAENREE